MEKREEETKYCAGQDFLIIDNSIPTGGIISPGEVFTNTLFMKFRRRG